MLTVVQRACVKAQDSALCTAVVCGVDIGAGLQSTCWSNRARLPPRLPPLLLCWCQGFTSGPSSSNPDRQTWRVVRRNVGMNSTGVGSLTRVHERSADQMRSTGELITFAAVDARAVILTYEEYLVKGRKPGWKAT